MIKVICENSEGNRYIFAYDGFPVTLVSTSGFSSIDFDVSTAKNNGQDGETYTGETAQKGNPVITAEILSDFRAQRAALFNFFQPRSAGIVYYYDDDVGLKTDYYVEKIEITETGATRPVTVSLICPDPKWYALEDTATKLAIWQGRIMWPLRITPSFVVTEKINTLIGNIHNDSSVILGLTIRFEASGAVVNPSLYDVVRHELLQINTTMENGDVILVTTSVGNKRAQLVSNGMTTNINNRIAYPPKWLQAYPGDNWLRYNAGSGLDSLSVTIYSTPAYWGA